MFQHITEKEYGQLTDSISLIAVLIAGADGKIDSKEQEWASKITKIRSYSYDEELRDFYGDVGSEFSVKFEEFIQDLPDDPESRNPIINEKLTALNDVLCKLDQRIGAKLYDSLISFAEHVAKASGGFLRFASVSREEKALMGLTMLEPIIYEPEEEEEPKFDDKTY